jgi:hypothetical protein
MIKYQYQDIHTESQKLVKIMYIHAISDTHLPNGSIPEQVKKLADNAAWIFHAGDAQGIRMFRCFCRMCSTANRH